MPGSKNQVRSRKPAGKNAQKGKLDESTDSKKEESELKSSSNSTILVVLVVLICVTWGVAATAYFGIVDYKGLIARSSKISAADATEYASSLYPFQYEAVRHPLRSIGSTLTAIDDAVTNLFTFTKAPFQIIDKRRQATVAPVRRMKKFVDLSKRDVPVEQPQKEPVASSSDEKSQEQVDVEKSKTPKAPKEPKQAESPKPPDDKPESPKEKTNQEPEKSKDSPKKKKKPRTLAEEDKAILDQLKEGEKLLAEKKGNQAWKFFKQLSEKYPQSPKAKLNRGKAEELLAEQQRSNPMLQQAIKTFSEVSEMSNAPKETKRLALMAKSEKEMFLGRMKPALQTQLSLSRMYPKDVAIQNQLGVRYLMLGNNREAKKVYEQVLKLAPDDGFALVHFGFILKTEGAWNESIPYLTRGVESAAPGTQEGKFYFHLGDALYRTGRAAESDTLYEKAAERGMFLSKCQRSLYNVDRLRGKPFWTAEDAGVKDYVRRLEMNWKLIRDEALSVMDAEKGLFLMEEESLKDTGEWRQFTLYQRGIKNENNCRRTPKTCSIIDRMPNAKGCRRGQVKFSVMMPGTHVWPHTGPTNCRLRMHLGLVIPRTGSGARLACCGEMRTWTEGKVLIFDDSFEHEVWQEAESLRLILIVDIWHPELTDHEKKTLSSI